MDIINKNIRDFSRKKIYLAFSIIIFFIFIGPLIYISGFVNLYSDDFCSSLLAPNASVSSLIEWYQTLNGRYVNAILSAFPVYDISVYRFIISMNIILCSGAIVLCIHQLFKIFEIDFKNYQVLFIGLSFFIFLIAGMPSLFEFFYWYASSSVHLIGFLLFLFFLNFSLKVYLQKRWYFLPAVVLVVLLNGNNELFLGFSNFTLLLLLILRFIKIKQIDAKLFVLNLFSWLSTLGVLLSPGTAARRSQFNYGGDVFISAKVAILYGGKFILENILEWPLILFFLAFFFLMLRAASGEKALKNISILPMMLISYLGFISIYFIKFYATGLVERDTGRIGDLLHIVLYVLILVNILNLALYVSKKHYFKSIKVSITPEILLILFFMGIALLNDNYRNVRLDIVSGDLDRFRSEIREREKKLNYFKGDHLVIRKIDDTRVLRSGDRLLMAEDWEWLRYCYLQYLYDVKVLRIQSFEIIE